MHQHPGAALVVGAPFDRSELARHLLRACPECRDVLRRRMLGGAAVDELPGGLVARATSSALAASAEAERRFEDARPELDEILAGPSTSWPGQLAAVPGLASVLAVRELRERAHESHSDDPHRALELAEAAVALAEVLTASETAPAGLREERAWARVQLARTLARHGRFQEASLALRASQRMESCDPLLSGFRLEVRGLVRLLKLEADEAVELLDRAGRIYQRFGDYNLVGRIEIMAAAALGDVHRHDEACRRLAYAIACIDATSDPRLMLVALRNYAFATVGAGDPHGAMDITAIAYAHFAKFGKPVDLLHIQWCEARILMQTDRPAEATETYLEVCRGFGELRLGMEFASVAIEAAEALVAGERWKHAAQIAAAAVEVEKAMRRARGALVAWLSLRKALSGSVVSASLVQSALAELRLAAGRK